MKQIAELLRGKVAEIGIDATCEWNLFAEDMSITERQYRQHKLKAPGALQYCGQTWQCRFPVNILPLINSDLNWSREAEEGAGNMVEILTWQVQCAPHLHPYQQRHGQDWLLTWSLGGKDHFVLVASLMGCEDSPSKSKAVNNTIQHWSSKGEIQLYQRRLHSAWDAGQHQRLQGRYTGCRTTSTHHPWQCDGSCSSTCGNSAATATSDAKVRFWTDARTENQKNQTVSSGSVRFSPWLLGCRFGSRFYNFQYFENRTFCWYFFCNFMCRTTV